MTRRAFRYGLAAALATLLLAGCAPRCLTVQYAPYQTAEMQKFGGNVFDHHLKVSQTGGMIVDGYMNGRALISNITDDHQNLRYHFEWFSSNGFPQGENTPWTPLSLGPTFSQVVTAVAPTPEAVNYELQVCQ